MTTDHSRPPTGGASTRPPRVLVVDDHEAVAEQVGDLLELYDIEVVGTVHDGAEVLPAMARAAADVVVLDVRMPHSSIDGLEAARLLATHWPGVAVILHTAFAGRLDDQATAVGAFAEVAKGTNPMELVQAIWRAYGATGAVITS